MKITFLSDSESKVNIFPELAAKLREEILDIETEEFFVPVKEDLPRKALELSGDTGLLVVFSLYQERTPRIEMLLGKLIDVELKTGIAIVKVFEESEVFDMESEEDIELEKEALAEKWGFYISKLLFHPDEFVPEK